LRDAVPWSTRRDHRRRRARRNEPRREATMPPLPGGVPERPKGTGCKPVGSAYGGSNPPAPILHSSAPSPLIGVQPPKDPEPSMLWQLKMVSALSGRGFGHWYSSLEVYDHSQDISEAKSKAARARTRRC